MIRITTLLLIFAGSLSVAMPIAAQQPIAIATFNRDTPVSFEKEIVPIFQKNCLACHSASEANGELVLESPQAMLKGGDSGPAIVPGKSAESLLLQLAAHQMEPLMPPPDNKVAAKSLTPQELGLIQLWINQGAKGSGSAAMLSPERWHPLPQGNHPIYTLALSPDGQFAACGRANQIFIYHVPTGQLVTRLNDPALEKASRDGRPGVAHLDIVQSLAFSKQGDLLASGGFRTVKLWRYPRDVQQLKFTGDTPMTALAVSADRKTVALGQEAGTIKLWSLVPTETDAAAEPAILTGHAGAIHGLSFTSDGAKLLSTAADKTVRVWNVADAQPIGRIDLPADANDVTTLLLPAPVADAAEPLPDIEHLATAGADNLIGLWRLPTALPQTLADAPEKTSVLAVSRDGTLLAMASAKGLVRVVRAQTNELVHQWQAIEEGPVYALALQVTPPVEAAEGQAEQPAADAAAATPQIRLAAAGADGAVHVFDAATGEEQLVLRGSLTAIGSIDFSPDVKQLVAGAADGAATLWSLEPIKPTAAMAKGDAPATVAVVSPDGKLLATNGTSGGRPAILVRDLETGKLLHTLLGHEGPVAALAFSNDNTRVASGSADKTARVWDLRDAKFPQVASFTGHEGAVTAVALNADASQVVSGAGDNTVKLWTVADATEVMNFAGHTAAIAGVAFGPGNAPISASADKTIRVWNAANGQVARTITEAAAISAFAVSRDGTRMSAALADKTIKVYNAADGNALATLTGHQDAIHSLGFNGDGSRLVSGAADGQAMVWEVADGRLLEILPVAGLAVATYGMAADRIIATDDQGSAALLPLRFAGALKGMAKPVTKIAYHPNGQLVLAACEDGTVRGYNPTTFAQAFAANHGAAVHDLAIRSDGQLMASAGEDKLVKLWNPTNGAAAQPAQLAGFAAPVRSVAFTDDGARVIGTGGTEEAGEVLVFNIAPPAGLLEQSIVGHAGIVQSCVSLGAGNQMISSAADGSLLAWEALAVRHIAGHLQPVTSIAAIPRQPEQPPELLSGSLDGTVRRWNALTGQSLAQLNHGGPVTSVAVRMDGQRWASASNNNTLRLWNATNNQQIAQMQGDIRAQTLVADLTGQKNDAANKVTQAKAALDEAEKDLPVKTTAETTTATALAAADKDVEAKSAALTAASTTKADAEKLAIEAAALAQQSALKMEAANQLALEMTAKARLLAETAERMRVQAAAAPENTQLAKAHADAMAAAATADAEAKAAEAAKAAPTKAATDTAQAAAAAAQQAVAMAQPFNEADVALAASQTAQRTAKQLHEFAARDLKNATAAVPAAKEHLAEVEALLKQLEVDVTAATAAEQQSRMPIHSVAFSPDGRTLASGGDFGVVHTWDAETGKAVSSYAGHAAPIAQVVYAADGALLSVAADNSAVVWEPNPDWQLERVIGDINDSSQLIDRVTSVDFDPEGKLLVAGGGIPSRSGELKVFSVADGTLVRDIPEPHTDAVASVAVSPDGRFVASAGADKYVKKWDVATGELAMQFEGHTNYVTGVTWRAGGNVLASSGSDSTIRIWDAVTGDRVRTIQGFTKQVSSVRFVGSTQFIVSSAGDPRVRMHNTDNGGVQLNYGGPTEYMFAVDAVGDQTNGVVVAGGYDGVLRIWQANGQSPRTIAPPEPEPTADQQVGSQ